MMELLNDIVIRCGKCMESLVFPKANFDANTYFESHSENGMGDEAVYLIDDDLECAKCGNKISIKVYGSEYPVGAFNFENCEIDGGTFIEQPHMSMVYFRDEFEIEEMGIYATGIQQLILEIADNKDKLNDVTSREFEEIVEQIFRDNGFETKLTQTTRDGGKDIIAKKYVMGDKPVVFYVECKKYDMDRPVGVSVIRSLYGVQAMDGVNKAIAVTSSYFTKGARMIAAKNEALISLIDGDELHRFIQGSAEKLRQKKV